MKILQIVGARPQFIKYFPVSQAIEIYRNNSHADIHNILIHTGQHYDYFMSKVFFDIFGIKEPEYHLGVGSGNHGEQIGQIIQRVEEVLIKEKPDVVLLYGDTNSTLGGAIAASKLHIPIAHIESGLRSYNKKMPEEINRILTDHVSSILFCPSEIAVRNLKKEGFNEIINAGKLVEKEYIPTHSLTNGFNSIVLNVGDVMYDAILHAVKISEDKSDILRKLNIVSEEYYLLTMHRAENTDNKERFKELIRFVGEVSKKITVIFPMHPRTKKIYNEVREKFPPNVIIIEPIGYFDILYLLKKSSLLMTDSGGMQKEAYWLKIPCITLRDETEWVETIQSGWNVLHHNYKGEHHTHSEERLLYGDGKAAERILKIICKLW